MIKGRLSFQIFPTIYEIQQLELDGIGSPGGWRERGKGRVWFSPGVWRKPGGRTGSVLRVYGDNQKEGRVLFSRCVEITRSKDGFGSPDVQRGETGSILRTDPGGGTGLVPRLPETLQVDCEDFKILISSPETFPFLYPNLTHLHISILDTGQCRQQTYKQTNKQTNKFKKTYCNLH